MCEVVFFRGGKQELLENASVSLLHILSVTIFSSVKMSKLSVCVLLWHGLFIIKNVFGTEVKLECPPGYIGTATKIYKSWKHWNSGKIMQCVSCSSKMNPTNSFEVCDDVNGFTDPNTAHFEYIGHFKASSYDFTSSLTTYDCRDGYCANSNQSCSFTVFQDKFSKRFKTAVHCNGVCSPCDNLASSAMPTNVRYSIYFI